MAEHRSILKNHQNTYHPCFGFTPKTGIAFPKTTALLLLRLVYKRYASLSWHSALLAKNGGTKDVKNFTFLLPSPKNHRWHLRQKAATAKGFNDRISLIFELICKLWQEMKCENNAILLCPYPTRVLLPRRRNAPHQPNYCHVRPSSRPSGALLPLHGAQGAKNCNRYRANQPTVFRKNTHCGPNKKKKTIFSCASCNVAITCIVCVREQTR